MTQIYMSTSIPQGSAAIYQRGHSNESFEVLYVNDKPYVVGSDIEGNARLRSDFVGAEEYFAVIAYSLSRVEMVKGLWYWGCLHRHMRMRR